MPGQRAAALIATAAADPVSALGDAIAQLRLAASVADVDAAVNAALRDLTRGSSYAVLHSDGDRWHALTDAGWHATATPGDIVGQPAPSAYLVARSGEVAIVVERASADATVVEALCAVADLALARIRASVSAEASRAEVAAVQTVAGQVLSVRDVEQVLLSVANTVLRLLDADICGVLLLEGDELVMRSCVGHRVAETASLRMRSGQGLAGRVLEVGTPWKVARYLEADDISRDFMSLAAKETAEAALGVPLRRGSRLIGVLEVWRRRRSVFTDDDVVLMTTLADLVSIAIDNADLYDSQVLAVQRATDAWRDLETQVAHLRRSTNLQRELLHAVVMGADRHALARVIGEELRCAVVILSTRGDAIATYPQDLDPPALPAAHLLRDRGDDTSVTQLRVDRPYEPAFGQQVRAGQTVLGALCLLGCSETEQVVELVLGQAASAYALHNLSERAASLARGTVRDEIVWDLVDGDRRQRVAALDRADRHGIDLRGSVRVLHGEMADRSPGDLGSTESVAGTQRRVREQVHQVISRYPSHLGSCRGDWVVVISRHHDRATLYAIARELGEAVRSVRPNALIRWGVSATCTTPVELPTSFREAKAAVRAATATARDWPIFFDDLGIVRVLFAADGSGDINAFIDDTLGPLVAYDAERDGALLATLKAYFTADCSQKDAAELIPVHHKTLRYRLDKIEELTGLDLNRHSDRLRASIALELLALANR